MSNNMLDDIKNEDKVTLVGVVSTIPEIFSVTSTCEQMSFILVILEFAIGHSNTPQRLSEPKARRIVINSKELIKLVTKQVRGGSKILVQGIYKKKVAPASNGPDITIIEVVLGDEDSKLELLDDLIINNRGFLEEEG